MKNSIPSKFRLAAGSSIGNPRSSSTIFSHPVLHAFSAAENHIHFVTGLSHRNILSSIAKLDHTGAAHQGTLHAICARFVLSYYEYV
jgi:hypothetical protein